MALPGLDVFDRLMVAFAIFYLNVSCLAMRIIMYFSGPCLVRS